MPDKTKDGYDENSTKRFGEYVHDMATMAGMTAKSFASAAAAAGRSMNNVAASLARNREGESASERPRHERHVIEPYSSDFGRNPSNALIGALAQAMAQRLRAKVEWDRSADSRDYLFAITVRSGQVLHYRLPMDALYMSSMGEAEMYELMQSMVRDIQQFIDAEEERNIAYRTFSMPGAVKRPEPPKKKIRMIRLQKERFPDKTHEKRTPSPFPRGANPPEGPPSDYLAEAWRM